MDIPFLLGAALTEDRAKARIFGFAVHFVAGLIFALFYYAGFLVLGLAGWGFMLLNYGRTTPILTVAVRSHRRRVRRRFSPLVRRIPVDRAPDRTPSGEIVWPPVWRLTPSAAVGE